MLVHQQLRPTTVVQVVVHGFVIAFYACFQLAVHQVLVESQGILHARLRFDELVAQLPGIGRRHDQGVRNLMDILPHGVEAGLHAEVVGKGIAQS